MPHWSYNMNEIERTIRELQLYVDVRWGGSNDMFNLALTALSEKAEREKGCEFCEDVPSRYRGIRAEGFYQVAADEVYNPELQVNFCPVCGKRLEVEHE